MNKSQIESKKILPHRKMWRAVDAVHPKLTLTKTEGEATMKIVAGINGGRIWERPLNKTELADFARRMGLRFRTMARHVTDTTVRHPEAVWLVKLGLDAGDAAVDDTDAGDASEANDEEGGEDGGEEEEPEKDEVVEPETLGEDRQPDNGVLSFFYGFDWELKNAWRRATNASEKDPLEYAAQVVAAGGDDGHPVASFSVGTAIIKAISNGKLKAIQATNATSSLWAGTTKTGAKIRIGRRKDRDPLVGMWEFDPDTNKEFMIFMVHVKVFGPPSELNDRSAADLTQVLAQKHANGYLRRQDLYVIKDAELAKLGLKVSGRVAAAKASGSSDAVPEVKMKRPAASAAAAAADEPVGPPQTPLKRVRVNGKSPRTTPSEMPSQPQVTAAEPADRRRSAFKRPAAFVSIAEEMDDSGWDLFG